MTGRAASKVRTSISWVETANLDPKIFIKWQPWRVSESYLIVRGLLLLFVVVINQNFLLVLYKARWIGAKKWNLGNGSLLLYFGLYASQSCISDNVDRSLTPNVYEDETIFETTIAKYMASRNLGMSHEEIAEKVFKVVDLTKLLSMLFPTYKKKWFSKCCLWNCTFFARGSCLLH